MSAHSEVTATVQSSTIGAGNDVRMHIGNVITNVYQSSEGAGLLTSGVMPPSSNDLDNLLPPRPAYMLERDTQRERIVNALLGSPNTRAAILGMGGIGKTTLAASIMWDFRIQEAYPQQYFLSFEGLSTNELVYNSLANTFDVPIDYKKSHTQVMSWILQYLGRKRTLICIDNFETFWEVPENRRAGDDFLAHLASIPNLAILATLRGVQRPLKLSWLRLDPLGPLTQDASIDLLHQITQDDFSELEETHIRDILEGVAGIPLAVTLVANLLSDGTESPHSLWRRWTAESTQAIGMDVDDRQYRLDVSLKLSVFGPRMSDDSRAVLAAISLLPAGLSSEDTWLDEYQGLLSPVINLRNCVGALRNTALCSLDKSTSPRRHQLLSPVRQFCLQNLPLGLPVIQKLIDLYISRLGVDTEFGSMSKYTWFTNELTNITSILNFAFSLSYITESLAYACWTYTRWMVYLGAPTTDIICKATIAQPEGSRAKAKCLQSHGEVLRLQAQLEEARSILQDALSIHREIGDPMEEAWDLMELGRTCRVLKRLDDAEGALNNALKLYQDEESQLGAANCLHFLSDLYDDMDKLSEAESSVEQAIKVFRLIGNRLGEANALNTLGWVYRRQGRLELAIETLGDAKL